MPNWTYNRVRVRGDDSEKIQEVKEEFPNALEPFIIAEVQKRFEERAL